MTRRQLLALIPAALDAQDRGAGSTPLFDGVSLRGWRIQHGTETAFHVDEGAIVVHSSSNFPTWLRSERQYENFDFECEFFVKGWIDSGVYLHAPEHGRPGECGMMVKLFHKRDEVMRPESMGAIFPVVPPRLINVKNQGEWNTLRIRMDWPRLQVWSNGEMAQDLDCDAIPELRYRLRSGFLGFQSLSYPIRFRNIRIRELPSQTEWNELYTTPADMAKWHVAEGKDASTWEAIGGVLRADGLGYLATNERWRDFALQAYVRASKHSNGGVLFRCHSDDPRDPRYEIQIHDVEGAVYPTGSLYGHRRAIYPEISSGEWYLLQLFVKDRRCVVRINGDTVVDYGEMDNLATGSIMLQAHRRGSWIEYKDIRVRQL